ncbi:hypothetical protein T09_14270 [Trichinella sp. T9]|nr:hypothetical protein T09_14270 [Trichinella sp. T9]
MAKNETGSLFFRWKRITDGRINHAFEMERKSRKIH